MNYKNEIKRLERIIEKENSYYDNKMMELLKNQLNEYKKLVETMANIRALERDINKYDEILVRRICANSRP